MKRENILISEDPTTKKVSATKFTAPGDIPAFDCSIHFGEEGNDVTMQNCNIEDNTLVKCSPDDAYDFETGALISLMKMCGSDKVVRACNEAFSYETDIKVLRKDNNTLREGNKGLQEEVKRLKGESENRWKIYQRNVQKKQDRIKQLEAQIKASEDDKPKNIEYYEKEIKNLNYRLTCKDISLEAKDKKISIYEKRILALEAENEKLKLDCEKLQHGYNDMMFCGGRQNGKQYTFLVELFKKLPQDKVDAAYKEAYGDKVIWCTSQSSTRDQLDSLIEGSKYTIPYTTEWIKPPTKREEMWEKIFALHKGRDVIIKVKREDVNTFLHEIENKIPEITWASSVKIFETKYTIKDIYFELKTHDVIYFRLWKVNKLSYSSDAHIYSYLEPNHIVYLPPMRWDLFKKGRIVIKVEKENYGEFCSRMFAHFDKVGVHAFNHDCKFGYFAFNKDTDYVERVLSSDCGQIKDIKRRKIVDWEDVR